MPNRSEVGMNGGRGRGLKIENLIARMSWRKFYLNFKLK